jgi:hypothetical protein
MGWFTKPIFIVLLLGICGPTPLYVGCKPIQFIFLGPAKLSLKGSSALGLMLNTSGMGILIVLGFSVWPVLR